jgi:hypothetical protein
MHNLDTNGWNEFPFSAQGYNFISKVAPNSPFMSQIARLPKGIFEQMNKSAIADLVGTGLTRDEVLNKLSFINEGGTHAVVELA